MMRTCMRRQKAPLSHTYQKKLFCCAGHNTHMICECIQKMSWYSWTWNWNFFISDRLATPNTSKIFNIYIFIVKSKLCSRMHVLCVAMVVAVVVIIIIIVPHKFLRGAPHHLSSNHFFMFMWTHMNTRWFCTLLRIYTQAYAMYKCIWCVWAMSALLR